MVELECIYADTDMQDIQPLEDEDFDFDIGTKNTFEVSFPIPLWDSMVQENGYIYCNNSEYGGRVTELESDTSNDIIYARGYTWRGMLDHRIITPADGEDYFVASGDLNVIAATVIETFCSGGIFKVITEKTGITLTNYQFDRYCTVLEGLQKLADTYNLRLSINCVSSPITVLADSDGSILVDEDGSALATEEGGAVTVGFVQITDHDEISDETDTMDYDIRLYHSGVNHLICLGQGDLAGRTRVDLYVDGDWNIGYEQYYFGLDEIALVYDYPNAESDEDLLEYGMEYLQKQMSYDQYDATLQDHDADDFALGDTVTGRDTVTGITITQSVTRKICKRKNGLVSIEHTLGGNS